MDRMMATSLRYEINKGNPNSRAKKQEILIAVNIGKKNFEIKLTIIYFVTENSKRSKMLRLMCKRRSK